MRNLIVITAICGRVTNTDIVSAAAVGIVSNNDANLLEVNGGHISCGREWAKGLLKRMGYVKRRANTKSKDSVEEFEALKTQFVFDIDVISQIWMRCLLILLSTGTIQASTMYPQVTGLRPKRAVVESK